MYSVEQLSDTEWCIVDEQQRTVFTGTWRAAEDWLDFQENMSRQAALAHQSPSRVVSAALSVAGKISRGVPTLFRKIGAFTRFIGRLSFVPGKAAQSQDFQEREFRTDTGIIVQRMEARRSGMVRSPTPVRRKNVHQKG
jgi:hypothetical protein